MPSAYALHCESSMIITEQISAICLAQFNRNLLTFRVTAKQIHDCFYEENADFSFALKDGHEMSHFHCRLAVLATPIDKTVTIIRFNKEHISSTCFASFNSNLLSFRMTTNYVQDGYSDVIGLFQKNHNYSAPWTNTVSQNLLTSPTRCRDATCYACSMPSRSCETPHQQLTRRHVFLQSRRLFLVNLKLQKSNDYRYSIISLI